MEEGGGGAGGQLELGGYHQGEAEWTDMPRKTRGCCYARAGHSCPPTDPGWSRRAILMENKYEGT